MTDAQFISHGGNRCPFCGSKNVEADGINADGPNTWDKNECHDCGKFWDANYSLVGYSSQEAFVPPRKSLERLAQFAVREGSLFVICAMDDDTCQWAGRLYRAKDVVRVLVGFRTEARIQELGNAEQLLGDFLGDDDEGEQYVQDQLELAGVRPVQEFWVPPGLDDEAARDTARLNGGDKVIEPVRPGVVEEIVDDVKDRAQKHAFSYSDYDNARDLAADSSETLDLDATDEELDEAARRLASA